MRFIEIIRKIGIFMIAAQVMIHLAPDKRYEKYNKLITGVIILAMLIQPFSGGENLLEDLVPGELFTETENIMGNGKELEELQAVQESRYFKYAEKEIKSKINNIATKNGYLVTRVETKMQEEEDGSCKMTLAVEIGREEQGIKIAPVCVSISEDSESVSEEQEARKLREEIAAELEIEETCVEVMIGK